MQQQPPKSPLSQSPISLAEGQGVRLPIRNQLKLYSATNDFTRLSDDLALALPETLPPLYRVLGVMHWLRGSRDTAWLYLNKALSEAQRLNDKELEAYLLFDMGNLSGNETAVVHYLDALKYFDALPQDQLSMYDKLTMLEILSEASERYDRMGSVAQIEQYYARIFQLAEETGFASERVLTVYARTKLFMMQNHQQSLDDAMLALNFIRGEHFLYRALPYTLQIISFIYCDVLNDYAKALEYGEEGLQWAEWKGDDKDIAMACNAVAKTHYH